VAQKETDAADVTLDLLAIQSHALEAIRDYSRYQVTCPAQRAEEDGRRCHPLTSAAHADRAREGAEPGHRLPGFLNAAIRPDFHGSSNRRFLSLYHAE
jgi:hypothetical protein